jgi:hypothetical protein
MGMEEQTHGWYSETRVIPHAPATRKASNSQIPMMHVQHANGGIWARDPENGSPPRMVSPLDNAILPGYQDAHREDTPQHTKSFEKKEDGRGAWRCYCCEFQGVLARQNRVLCET